MKVKLRAEKRSKIFLSNKKVPKELIPIRNLKAEIHTMRTVWYQLSWKILFIFVRTRIWNSAQIFLTNPLMIIIDFSQRTSLLIL